MTRVSSTIQASRAATCRVKDKGPMPVSACTIRNIKVARAALKAARPVILRIHVTMQNTVSPA